VFTLAGLHAKTRPALPSDMPDFETKPLRLSELNSVLLLVVVLAVAAVVIGFLVRDYFVTRKRARRFLQRRKSPEAGESPPSKPVV
jgi:hypothetical protein